MRIRDKQIHSDIIVAPMAGITNDAFRQLCFEFGAGQPDAVCEILEMNGYTILERTRDYNDRERAVIAQYSRKED